MFWNYTNSTSRPYLMDTCAFMESMIYSHNSAGMFVKKPFMSNFAKNTCIPMHTKSWWTVNRRSQRSAIAI
jgi:hypothetical protein